MLKETIKIKYIYIDSDNGILKLTMSSKSESSLGKINKITNASVEEKPNGEYILENDDIKIKIKPNIVTIIK